MTRFKMSQIKSLGLKIKKSKYNNIKTVIDGITFASKAEAKRYRELKLLESACVIRDLTCQPVFLLQPAFVDRNGKRSRKIEYWADFKYWDFEKNTWVVEDVKGKTAKLTADFKIKWKIVRCLNIKADMDFDIVRM